jgi:CRISPR-associated protein Csa3
LEEIHTGENNVKNLSTKIGISRGMTYNHIRELREMGLIDENSLNITSAGELAII